MKPILNLLVKWAVSLYVHLSPTKIERIGENWRPTAELKSILVFSNTALGDTLLSTPAIVSLKQSFPQAKLTLFVHRNMAPLFKGLESVDEMVPYHGGYSKFVRTVFALRRIRPQVAILLHSNAPQDIPMAVLSGAQIILKTSTSSEYRPYLSYQFTKKSQHVIEERLDLVRLLGGTRLTTRMCLPPRYNERRVEFLRGSGKKRIIGFQPGAANTWRMWPAENFSALADRLTESLEDVEIVITGSRKERSLAQKIINSCTTSHIHDRCGKYGIQELPFLVGEFNLLVTNDTGTMHLAITLGVPTVCLFGASSAGMIGPYQDPKLHHVVQKNFESRAGIPKKKRTDISMRQITVAEVFNATIEMLERQHSKNS